MKTVRHRSSSPSLPPRSARYGYSHAGAGDQRLAPTEHAAERKQKSRTTMSSRTSTAPTASASPTSSSRPPASTLAEAGSATLSDTLSFNGVLRANQEAVVQVTPRFPGIVRVDPEAHRRHRSARTICSPSIESNQSLTVYELKAPIAGTVIDRQISLGEYASEQKPAFVVADLSTDLGRSVGLPAGPQARPDRRRGADRSGGRRRRRSRATISYVAPVGASDTQTALARVVLPNADGGCGPACSSRRG